jgi:hypothetical protein
MAYGSYVPAMNLYDMIGGIADPIVSNLQAMDKRNTLSSLGAQLQKGDFEGATATALKAGGIGTGLKIMEMSRQQKADSEAFKSLGSLGGGISLAPSDQNKAPISGMSARDAIAAIESQGSGDYSALGPVTKGGDRAYGRYQVMGSNIGPWTQQALGRSMSPQEFLASPDAQNKVFDTVFGGYLQKHGPQDAASMWFTGKPLAQGAGLSDVNGMTGQRYADRFASVYGGGGQPAPVRVADASGVVPQSAPQPAPQSGLDSERAAIIGQREQLANIYARPNLSESARSAIKARVDSLDFRLKELDRVSVLPKDRPSAVQEFEYAKQNGFTGSFQDWKASSRPTTTVNIDQKGEAAYQQEAGKGIAKKLQDISTEGDTARNDMALIGQLRDLGGVIGTGAPAAIQAWLADKGIKVGNNVGAVEAYSSIVDKLTPSQRVPGTGATSDYEAKLFKASLPRLINTPEGNAVIEQTLSGMAQSKIDRAMIAEKALAGELSPKEALKALRELPSPYEAVKAAVGGKGAATPQGAPQPAAEPQKQGAATQSLPDGYTAARALAEAKAAIASGKSRAGVIDKIKSLGLDPSGL